MHSLSEENYLKAVYMLSEGNSKAVSTSTLAEHLGIQAASVTDKLKKLAEKKLFHYEKSKGVKLSAQGKKIALEVVRKHRLWELFLVEKMGFGWDEVHDIAEQLEHIQSTELIDRLDALLGFPKYDPHGDPIPDANGKLTEHKAEPISAVKTGKSYKIVAVGNHSQPFLKHLEKKNIELGSKIKILEKDEFDHSLKVLVNGNIETNLSHEASLHIWVK